MSKDISIVFKSQDQLSQPISQMRQKLNEFSKDIEEYKKIQDKAFGKEIKLQLDTKNVKKELTEINKLIKQSKDISEKTLQKKQKEIKKMSEDMKKYNKIIKEVNKAEDDLYTRRNKKNNDPNYSSITGLTNNSNNLSLGKQLLESGMFIDLGNSIGNYMGVTLSSKYGDKIGNKIGGAISGALGGALAGGMVGGPIGAAVGGVVGIGTSIVNSAAEEKKEKDDYFKDEVKNVYAKVDQLTNVGLQSGIVSSKQREKDLFELKSILGEKDNAIRLKDNTQEETNTFYDIRKSLLFNDIFAKLGNNTYTFGTKNSDASMIEKNDGRDNAKRFINDIEKFASKTPFQENELINLSKGMLTYGWKQEEIFPDLTKLGDSFTALGINSNGQNASITALGRMKSSNKTTLDNINIIQNSGIDAVEILAEKMETDKAKVYEMISKGAINGADASRTIIDAIGEEYKGVMEEFSQTTSGLESTLADLKSKGDRAEGDGYNQERKKGLEAQIDYLQELKTQDRKYIGEYKANLKNKEEAIMRNNIEEMKKSKEYREAQSEDNGAEMGKLLAQAQTKAIVEWNNSSDMKEVHESELQRIKATQKYIKESGTYVEYGRESAEQFNMGWDSVKSSKISVPNSNQNNQDTAQNTIDNFYANKIISHPEYERYWHTSETKRAPGYASGIKRVPRDNYPALLHEDEQVLTADEARQLKKDNKKVNIENININVSSENDKEIAEKVVARINNAMENIA